MNSTKANKHPSNFEQLDLAPLSQTSHTICFLPSHLADLKTLHESDLCQLSEASIKYKVGIEEVVEECEQRVGRERASHREALEKGRYQLTNEVDYGVGLILDGNWGHVRTGTTSVQMYYRCKQLCTCLKIQNLTWDRMWDKKYP